MKEFMLLIRKSGDHESVLSPEEHRTFLQKCEQYIDGLKKEKKLIAAQPLVREGKIISVKDGSLTEAAVDATKEIQNGYYHILARDIEEAVAIAKDNPEFAYGNRARIEVRPIKMKEDSTGYVYPV